MANKAEAARRQFGAVGEMQRRYTVNLGAVLNDTARRGELIANESLPTCTVMCAAYGRPNVSVILEGHLAAFGDAMGATYTAPQLQQIADDVLSSYHYLTLADIILALKMGREGRFRDGQGRNIATTYGALSVAVVSDVVYRYNRDVRVPAIDRREQQRNQAYNDGFTEILHKTQHQNG